MKNVEKENIKIKVNSKFYQNNKNEKENPINELNYHKLQIENVKKDNEIFKIREEIQQYKKCGFDTSSSFPWPTEFKNRWGSFVHTIIMDSFDTINSNYILLMRTINIIIETVYDISKNQIRQKIIELLKCLGLKNISDINISNFYNKFQRLLFQDFFKTLFIVSTDFYNSILLKIKNEIFNKKNLFKEKEIEEILKDLNNDNFPKFVKEIYFLCLYMNINEPRLIIKTSTEINYRYYNKNEYDIIEGFPKNNDICIIILNPPIIGDNQPFKGIKPAVIIVDNPTKEIIDICKEQNKNKLINNNGDNYNKNNCKLIINKNNYEENDYLNLKKINNKNDISSEEINFPNDFMTINYKINNNKYKENNEPIQKKNFAKTIIREDNFKIKNYPDYSLKKHIINPINIQKYMKKNEEAIVQKNFKDKFKNIHFINPQKILNINKIKIQSNKKKKKLNEINIENNNNTTQNNDKKYTYTESNINMSSPLAYSILDTANNMINLVAIKKKLGLLFYSDNKSQSPSLMNNNNNNNLTNRAKRRINPRRISNILNQITLENNKDECKNLIKYKDTKKNNTFNNNSNINKINKLEHEKVNSEIKQINTCLEYSNKEKNKISNNFINSNFNDNINNNINDIINSDIIMKTILNNNKNELLNNIEERRFIQKSNNNLKNINNIFNINNNLNNNNKYNNESKNNRQTIQEKYSLRRKINNSINISKKNNIDNNNININSINSTNNNNNISINININNSNNNNENNFRGNVILNYENKSSKITKTEPDIDKKIIEKSFQKINAVKYIGKNRVKNKNIKKNNTQMNTLNSHMKKIIDYKSNNIFETANNTISYKTNFRKSKQKNKDNYSRITFNSVMKTPNIINNNINNNINSNIYNLNLNNEKIIKTNKYKNLYKSQNNFINKNPKISKENLYNKNKDINKRDNSLKKKSISYEPICQIKNYILEKSQENKLYSNYNNTLNYRNHNKFNDKHFDNLNKSFNSIKKYNKNKTQNILTTNNKIIKNSDYFIFMTHNRKKGKNDKKNDIKLEKKFFPSKKITNKKSKDDKISHFKISSSEGMTNINIERSYNNSKQKISNDY